MNRIGVIIALFISVGSWSQESIVDSASFYNFVLGKDVLVDKVLKDENFRVQLVYTAIKDSSKNNPETIDLSSKKYFYPASTVKFPIAILTIEKLNRLNLSLDDVLKIKDDSHCGNANFISKSQQRNLSFREMITELIVVSDNDYYNSLYHFLTPKEINESLHGKGFVDTHIYKSFSGCNPSEQLHCNSIEVRGKGGEVKYKQEECSLDMAYMARYYAYDDEKLYGSKHEENSEIVNGPFDFNYNLEMPLLDGHNMMLELVLPSKDQTNSKWNITKEQKEFLIDLMSKFPKEIANSKYKNQKNYPNNIYKYAVFGEHPHETKLKTVSKIGLSYGFTTEYVTVYSNLNVPEYVLSISIYTNSNDVVNDGEYEYDSVAKPFCDRLSRILLGAK